MDKTRATKNSQVREVGFNLWMEKSSSRVEKRGYLLGSQFCKYAAVAMASAQRGGLE
jgi:hypothetical protein